MEGGQWHRAWFGTSAGSETAGRVPCHGPRRGWPTCPSPLRPSAARDDPLIMPEDPRARAQRRMRGYAEAGGIVTRLPSISGGGAGCARGETDLDAAFDRVFRRIEGRWKRVGASWDAWWTLPASTQASCLKIGAMEAYQGPLCPRPPYPAWTAIDVDPAAARCGADGDQRSAWR